MTDDLELFEVRRGGRGDPAAGPRLDAAMAAVGACYLRDPGLAPGALRELERTTAAFFHRPAADKLALAAQGAGKLGYRPAGSGSYGAADGTTGVARDRCELFKIGRAESGGEPAGWGDREPAMRAAWRDAYAALERTAGATAHLLAEAAGPADPGIAGWMGSHASNLATNWYPGPDQGPGAAETGAAGGGGTGHPDTTPTGATPVRDRRTGHPDTTATGALRDDGAGGLRGAHTDFGPFTLLHHPGGVGGLELEAGGRWIEVAPRPGALVLLLGDLLPFAMAGRWRAPRHRVSAPAGHGERMSVVFFVFPHPATVVQPADGSGPATTAGGFVAKRLDRVYA